MKSQTATLFERADPALIGASAHEAPAATAPLRVVSVDRAEDFLALAQTWRSIWNQAHEQSPFNTWEFASAWYECFVAQRLGGLTGDVQVLIALDQTGRAAAIAPMFVERNMGRGDLGQTLQPFGRSTSVEMMTDEPMMVARGASAAPAHAAFRRFLTGRAPGSAWDVAVTHMPVAAVSHAHGTERRLNARSVEVVRSYSGNVSVELPKSWEPYRRSLSKSMRDNLAYYPRRLHREIGPFSVEIARKPAAVALAVDQLVRLHRMRSLAHGGTPHRDHIPSPEHAAFLHQAMVRLARQGLASVATLSITGQVIAAHAFMQTSRGLWTYYSGFNPAWHRFSPLTIITAEVLRDAIGRGLSTFTFPPGAALWKSRWGGVETRGISESSIYATRPAALLRGFFRRRRWRAHMRLATAA